MQSLLRNMQFAFRLMGRTPGITAAAVLTLALGIGANSAIFSVINALLLKPFPYRDPAQLVSVEVRDKILDRSMNLVRYEMLRDRSRSFREMAVWANDQLNLTGNGEPVQIAVGRVSPNFFSLLGVVPQLGRDFTAEEGQPQGKPVVLLSDALWRARYHSDPGIVGQTVKLDATAATVIGVLPAHVTFPFVGKAEIWTPRYFEYSLMPTQRLRQGVGYLNLLARLRTGVTVLEANTELSALNEEYRRQNSTMPDADPQIALTGRPLRDVVAGELRSKVLVLMGAVGAILLIACGNVGSLLLSRAMARRREVAVRAALGAKRSTIVGQLLTESLLLALIAAAFGIALGWGATRALAIWGAAQMPQGVPVGIDWRVLLFTLTVSVLAGILFGMAPALQLSGIDINGTLREEGRGASSSAGRVKARDVLVVGQIALSLILLISAGLLVRSFVRLLAVDPGFEARNRLTMSLTLSTLKYSTPAQQTAFFDEVLRRAATVPGVRSAAISAAQPLTTVRVTPVLPQGQPDRPLAERPFVTIEAVSPGWFSTMHIPLRTGRPFDSNDQAQSTPVVIANESFVREYWPGLDPLAEHVVLGRRPVPAQVVGVAADVKNTGLEQETRPQLYLPFSQLPWSSMNLVLRTEGPPQTVIGAVRAQIAAIDPDQPLTDVQSVEDLVDAARAQPRFLLVLVGGFAGLALLLAIIGIYGVLSFSVAQRRQEFGVRMAMGADRENILAVVLKHGFVLAIIGVGLGLAAAFLLAKLMAGMLYQTPERDPLTFVAAPIALVLVALMASYLPARRATRVNPVDALR
ncbi:ABC transporter permease [Acidobacteria bacterium AB60]|nr:ABC transporter permease [Acidobacteria bacterium AB60]